MDGCKAFKWLARCWVTSYHGFWAMFGLGLAVGVRKSGMLCLLGCWGVWD